MSASVRDIVTIFKDSTHESLIVRLRCAREMGSAVTSVIANGRMAGNTAEGVYNARIGGFNEKDVHLNLFKINGLSVCL